MIGGLSLFLKSHRLSPSAVLLLAIVFLIGAMVVALFAGAVPIFGEDVDSSIQTLLFDLRSQRVCAAAVIGGLLGLSGALVQALFRNPLAEPYIIGVSSGAAVGAVGFSVMLSQAMPIGAFVGALSVCFLLWIVSKRLSVGALLLFGIALNSLGGALVALLSVWLSGDGVRQLWFWLLGGLQFVQWPSIGLGALALAAMLIWGLRRAMALDWMLLGVQVARAHGVDERNLHRLMLMAVAVLIAFSVSMAGMIGFIGLIVPHFARLLVGAMHRWVLPVSTVLGACVLVLADCMSRVLIAPSELPVGAVTALMGAPVLLLLIIRCSIAARGWFE